MPKKIIGLTGHIACGKGMIKRYIIEKYKAEDCRFSSILRDILTRIGEESSRENMAKTSLILRENFGENILAKAIAKDIEKLDSNLIVIDGIRRMADIEYLKKMPEFVLVRIDSSPEIRYKRMIGRDENPGDAQKTFEEFIKDHEAKSDNEVQIVMDSASKSLDNNGSVENLYKQIDQIINS